MDRRNCLCIRMVMHMGIVAGLPCPGLEIRMDAAKTMVPFRQKERLKEDNS